ncbi:MAG TPA: tRNA (adenosine(37)-N6)-threonylcarbamoyltransferase complex ATPase subunit type 1 TsaE [Albidovulum sp.]|uniref:tRNA (adenosine(37)-N6)-threonylcarbamoyltransferase complex ATPase subunit type 1 TsaE n=1 Tax=Albidovulum sp. TaxID=1872424 RepID=UPI002C509A03|nr:tRNA (adenosine(37)-N6)-threonylcarbamoyltransferase complex ATPase subunit type 1 TsaE [Albidovulum sp.]
MVPSANPSLAATLRLASPEATERLAVALANVLAPGDTILLEGPIGAGKSHFCRAAIRHLLSREGFVEDIPSPTFTLVQTYVLPEAEIWHADLYRLTNPAQIVELGLEEAFETAITFVEWPDRLGTATPRNALHITLSTEAAEDLRIARILATDPRWNKLRALLPADIVGIPDV